MLIVAIVLCVAAAVALLVGIMELTGTLPGNHYFGVTTAPAIRTEVGFRLANRVAAPTTLVAGGLLIVGAVAALTLGSLVGGLVAVVAAGTALYTAGTGVAMGTRAAEALDTEPAPVGACGRACGTCSTMSSCAVDRPHPAGDR